jgi:hypothetical protein
VKRERGYRWALVGRFCPTDANPETDIDPAAPLAVFGFATRQEAQDWTGGYWYPTAEIIEVRDPAELGSSRELGGSAAGCSSSTRTAT